MTRGFVSILFLIILFLLIALSAAWWVDREQTASITEGSNGVETNRDLIVEPLSGVPPLSVSFAVRRDIGTVQTVNYGDGTSAHVSDFICGLEYCVRRHTYEVPGTYAAAYEDASGVALRSFTIIVAASP